MSNTEAIIISESEVNFGPFLPQNLFYLEKSDVYRRLGEGFSTVEFMCIDTKKNCLFIEAKSSSPSPNKEDKTDFDEFIDDIATKFQDSYQLFLSSILGRRVSSDIGSEVLKLKLDSLKVKFILVIPKHKIAWLPPLNEALRKRLRKTTHIWNIDVAVMNEEIAREHRLIA